MRLGRPTDDRGRPCALATLSLGQVARRALGLEVAYDEATKRELEVTGGTELAVAIAGSVVGAIVWGAAFQRLPAPWSQSALVMFGGYVVVAPAIAMVAWLVGLAPVRRRRARRLARTYLARGRCGGCGYALEGLVPEGDGCVVCPECGAAWREARAEDAEA